MRLKDNILTHEIDGTQFLVPVGAEAFKGIVRSNSSAAFIVNCLKEEVTRDQIVDAMCDEYDAPREVLSADVDEVLDKLCSIGALTEEQ